MINSQFIEHTDTELLLQRTPTLAHENYNFSLIVATLNRTAELDKLLFSLTKADPLSFEVIIVDQNQNKQLEEIVELYSDIMNIKHICFHEKNASMARNFGALAASGNWLAFPDDDCCYLPETLICARELIKVQSFDLLIGCLLDFDLKPWSKFVQKDGFISSPRVLQSKIKEPTIFIRKCNFTDLKGFDERFGPGAEYNSGEGIELAFRILKRKQRILFSSKLQILHSRNYDEKNLIERSYRYAYGTGTAMINHYPGLAFYDLIKNIVLLFPRLLLKPPNKRALFINCIKGLLTAMNRREQLPLK